MEKPEDWCRARVEGVTGRRRAGPEAGDGMRDEG